MLWKYGVKCSKNAAGDDIEVWESKEIPKPGRDQIMKDVEEYETHLKQIEYVQARRASYDPVGEQLGRITKALKYLQDKGVEIGPQGVEQIEHVEEVKARFPKK